MLAIIELNGKQYQIEEGRYLMVDLISDKAVDEVFELGKVLMVVDGETTLLGAPFVEGATVKAKITRHARGPKILVYKMRCKKGYRLKNGHRQDFTQIQIESLDFPGRTSEKVAKQDTVKAENAPKASKKAAAEA